jgi:molybdopterin converting factor small subunit
MAITLLFFGRLRDAAGGGRREFAPAATLVELLARLERDDPHLAAALGAPDVRTAVNQRLIPPGTSLDLAPGDEIAFMPPATGG